MENQNGTELKVGMIVKGYITILRSYGRTFDKNITGRIVEKNNNLYVKSDKEKDKYYSLNKFEHNFLTKPSVIYLEIVNP